MSKTSRDKLPKYTIPFFMIWVALCNIVSIIISIMWFNFSSLGFGIVIGINALSIVLLYPLFNMDPIKPFINPALIWFIIVSVVYIVLAVTLTNMIYYFLIPGSIQLAADIWFHWQLSKIKNN